MPITVTVAVQLVKITALQPFHGQTLATVTVAVQLVKMTTITIISWTNFG
jgi:hypothetical protein